jgi:hypothetical protein
VEQAPPERPEDPLPEEQEEADGEQEAEEEEAGERGTTERGRPRDLALDLVGLGLREIDVRAEQREGGVPRGSKLGTQARRGFITGGVITGGVITPGVITPGGPRLGGGTLVVGCGPVGIQRSSSREGLGSVGGRGES